MRRLVLLEFPPFDKFVIRFAAAVLVDYIKRGVSPPCSFPSELSRTGLFSNLSGDAYYDSPRNQSSQANCPALTPTLKMGFPDIQALISHFKTRFAMFRALSVFPMYL